MELTNNWLDRCVPGWKEVLVPLADKPLNMLELGSFEGASACWFDDHVLLHPASRLLCVDSWSTDTGNPDADFIGVYARFLSNILHRPKVRHARSHTVGFLRSTVQRFDAIYIDASHEAADALTDLVLSWILLKPGGLLAFDDYEYTPSNPTKYRVLPKVAWDSFEACFKPEVVYKGWQVIARKL